MDSPFSNTSTFTLYLEPVLNSFYKTYQHVITLDHIPNGPLSNLISTISPPKLSSFQQPSPFDNFNCTHVLVRFPISSHGKPSLQNPQSFMSAEDIPSVFSYLRNNGYTIDTDLTKIINSSNIGFTAINRPSGKRNMICIASYNS